MTTGRILTRVAEDSAERPPERVIANAVRLAEDLLVIVADAKRKVAEALEELRRM